MESCYIAAPFLYGEDNSLSKDIRSIALGNASFLLYPSASPAMITFCGHTYAYIGPFWFEETSDGQFTDCDSSAVVLREKHLIDQADVFIAVLDDSSAPGTITELVYAATAGKKIFVVYFRMDNTECDFPSPFWYPIVFTRIVAKQAQMIAVTTWEEVAALFGRTI